MLLIDDNNQADQTMAFVSLTVNVGSFNDPPHRLGLAHFLEHMIFMGSKEYPDESAYSNHISESGGFANAFTELENTTYYFDIDSEGLLLALHMMANNFLAPLLDADMMERELNAIESEFKMSISDDECKMIQVLMSRADKSHIFNRFMWGSKKSLLTGDKTELWEDLQKFYNNQYSADRMKLVIQCKTTDKLEKLKGDVVECFSQIVNKNLGSQDFSKVDGCGSSNSE